MSYANFSSRPDPADHGCIHSSDQAAIYESAVDNSSTLLWEIIHIVEITFEVSRRFSLPLRIPLMISNSLGEKGVLPARSLD